MALPKHLELADSIKSIHQKLRDEAKALGADEAWQKHCEDKATLEKYAAAMQNLATKYWENNNKNGTKVTSRVEWIYNFCQKYFSEEEIDKYRQKEIAVAKKLNLEIEVDLSMTQDRKLQVLDVGSCYNPLKIYSIFDVTPIDIAPANSDVHRCDFLNLKLTSSAVSYVNDSEITELQRDSFDVVVFSLLLEYLPSPMQRHLCCVNAYNLLKTDGILIIVTPDSVGTNAKIMKSWRFIMAKLGFLRIRYEKLLHLHCMVFRKSPRREVPQRWATLQDEARFFEEMVIPQDFKKIEEANSLPTTKETCDVSLFDELPFMLGE